MQEMYEDLFSLTKSFDAICITTNGIVKSSGAAVMGAGIAKTCAETWPQTPSILGEYLTTSGLNIPFQLGCVKDGLFLAAPQVEDGFVCRIFSFPTKHHYANKSDIDLIKRSCIHMVDFANQLELKTIALSRPGCGMGGLSWEKEVRPAISDLLDNRFYVIERKGN